MDQIKISTRMVVHELRAAGNDMVLVDVRPFSYEKAAFDEAGSPKEYMSILTYIVPKTNQPKIGSIVVVHSEIEQF